MHKKKLIISSNNIHKIREIKEILGEYFEILPKSSILGAPEIEETGHSFLENAQIKAIGLSHYTAEWVLADDSGIEVDALNGAPGIYSARFAGPNATDEDNNQKLLELLRHTSREKRTARYQCAMVIAHQDHELAHGIGSCEGVVLSEYQGQGGFGYDPLFWDESHQKTFAQLTPEEKNQISHRRRALKDLLGKLKSLGI